MNHHLEMRRADEYRAYPSQKGSLDLGFEAMTTIDALRRQQTTRSEVRGSNKVLVNLDSILGPVKSQ